MNYTEDDIAIVALREYAGVGARTFQLLMTHFGSPRNIFDSDPGEIAALPRMSEEKEEQIRSASENDAHIRRRLSSYSSRGIEMTTILNPLYPESLLELGDSPPLIYWQGNLPILQDNCVAIVGSHEATTGGIAEAVRIGKLISAEGVVVVSGLARGIDSAAHVGAIQNAGKTVAVLGCGFDDIYPSENKILAQNIVDNGLLLSEYPPEAEVSVGRLMARNRIIVALAKSIIVVEITSRTGGTAEAIKETIKQGKSLYTCFNPNLNGSGTNSMGAVHLDSENDWRMVLKYMV